jgi:spermidine synthase
LSRRQALRTYAVLELAVLLAALAIAAGAGLLTPILRWAYRDGDAGLGFAAVRLACGVAALLAPAIALGATFPMAVRCTVDSPAHLGGPAGRLYAANTAGAALGAIGAGFLLIPAFGLMRTTLAGVAATSASIVIALSLARRARADETPAAPLEAPVPPPDTRPIRRGRKTQPRAAVLPRTDEVHRHSPAVATAVLALTGLATFLFEVVWTRVLSMVLGPSTYAFAATLSSFIVGLACGSYAGAFVAERVRRPALALASVLIATAGAACAAIAQVGGLEPGWVMPSTAAAPTTLASLALPHVALAFRLTWPIAVGLGVAFPLSLEVAGGRDVLPARRIGGLYAVNTAASVAGALLAGFVAIPAVGLRATLLVAAGCVLAAAGVIVAWGAETSRVRLAGLAPIAALAAWMVASQPWDAGGLASGGYLYSRFVPAGVDRAAALAAGRLLYYEEGATGTVSVKELTGDRSLAIDGKVDASTARDMLTQKALAHLPLLLHPNPRTVAVVGLGSGVTLGAALVHPVASVEVIEISPEVIAASRYFEAENHHALDDPRTRLITGDGRSHLALTSRVYDVVISEPSNPWMAGVAALFTQTFFSTVRDRLAANGIFCQWANTYGISDADLRSIVATFRSVFPESTMWLAGDGDLLLIGSPAPLEPRLAAMTVAWTRPGVAQDLGRVHVREPFGLMSLYVGGPNEMTRYAGEAPVQTDDRMALEFSAPLAVFAGGQTTHDATLRSLLDGARRPTAIEQAFARAGAAEWRDRGEMMMGAQAYETAFMDYASAVRRAPTDAAALDGLVRAAAAARRESDAESLLKSLTTTLAAEPAPRVALAKLLGARGRFDEAIDAAGTATAASPGDAAAWEQLASLHADRGDVTRLKRTVEVMRRDFPGRAASWYFAASERFLDGNVSEALPLAQRAVEIDPDYADAYNLLGAAHAESGQTAAARQAFRASLRLDPRDSVTYTNLAQLELADGQRAVAAGLFAEALSLDPGSVPARDGLAQARAR